MASARVRELQSQAQGLLRVEVTFRSMEIRERGLRPLEAWHEGTADRQWSDIMSRVIISSGVELAADEVLALPRRVRAGYELWLRGADCFELMTKSTRYRHRRELLELTGGRVDIFQMREPVRTQDTAIADLGAWLREAPEWHASGGRADLVAAAA